MTDMPHATTDAAAIGDVRELVRREGECCAFLRLDLEAVGDALRLRIEAPAEATEAGALDVLLSPFLAGAPRDPRPLIGTARP